MSVHRVTRKGKRDGWKVRCDDHAGRPHSETYDLKPDAVARDGVIRQAKQRGEPIPRRGRGKGDETFKDFAQNVWWPQEGSRLAPKTQTGYAGLLDRYVMPVAGADSVAYIDTARVFEIRAEVEAIAPGYSSARALKLFRQILGYAVQLGRISFNPADVLRARKALKPQTRQGDVRALDPVEVEAARATLLKRRTPHALRDATFVSLMAYAGLRPEEALALQWEHIETSSIRVVQANQNGKAGETKTGKPRTVRPLISPLVDDLNLWRNASGQPRAKAYVLPNDDGGLWDAYAYANWRARVFKPVAPDDATPYSCRHGFASLLIREGKTLADVSRLMGNSAIQVAAAYTHVMERYADEPSQPMESLVQAARSVRKVSERPSEPIRLRHTS